MSRLDNYRPASGKKGDTSLIFTTLILALIGLLMISSASVVIAYEQFGKSNYYWTKQVIYLIIAGIAMAITSQIDYRFWKRNAVNIMAFTLVLLTVVLIPGIGQSLGGASRWISLGPFLLQPSELAKLALIVYLAAWFENRESRSHSIKKGVIPFASIVSLMVILIIKQPDMGTMIVVVAIAGILWFSAGAKFSHMIIGLMVAGVVFFGFIKSSSYRMERLTTYLNPKSDTLGSGYQINQAEIAIGSGGLWGLGFGQSKQKYLYLPQPHTDAIFAIIVEELGFIRVAIIFCMIGYFIWRGYNIATQSMDKFGYLVACGVTSWIAVQVIINVSAITGLIPLTGIPLPFLSFGGSSLLFICSGIGIVYNISKSNLKI